MSVVRIIEVIFTKNVWAFSRDQVNCPYSRGVRTERFDCTAKIESLNFLFWGAALISICKGLMSILAYQDHSV